MRLLDALKPAADFLDKAGIDDPLAEAEILVFHAAGLDRLAAYVDNPETGKTLLRKIRRLLARRAKGEPLQYITGYVDFLGLTIAVGKDVLIPRPETELLAQEAIKAAGSKKQEAPLRILDLCTGSGCVALAMARELPEAEVSGTDISGTAVSCARKNAEANGIVNAKFFRGSLFEPLKKASAFDLIVSNPPYIKTSDIDGLQREIREWEPGEALDGGADGLDFYRRIFSDAGRYLKRDGAVILEIGYEQAEEVRKIAQASGYFIVSIKKDYAGIERIVVSQSSHLHG